MNILLIGSGGREHAFAYKIKQSKHCNNLYILPGNAGTAMCGTNINIHINDFLAIEAFCIKNHVNLVVVGPEDPLVNGLRDYFNNNNALKNIPFVGPDKSGAIIEGSKDWSKDFMQKYNIPTAAYKSFNINSLEAGKTYIKNHSLPVVLKADGLAAGKGVLICNNTSEAEQFLEDMIAGNKFGNAGNTVVIEEFLQGIECSVFVVTDGNSYKILPVAKDYKRIGEGDTGLNTGGMGAVCPVPFADDTFINLVETNIVIPTINGLKAENINYVGFIFIGLMNVNGKPYVIEYNCRMGDPETEVVLPLIESDFVELLHKTGTGSLQNYELKVSNKFAATVMLVSSGYPEVYEKNKEITGLELVQDALVFHAGTKKENNQILSNGGRVLTITAFGNNIAEAAFIAKENAKKINFSNKYFRNDIGYEFE